MPAAIRLVHLLSRLCGAVAAAMIVTSVVVVCQMVFVRYVLGHSTVWQTPFATYALIAATFLGAPYVLLLRGHVNVDLLPIYAGRRMRFAMAVAANLVSLAFCGVVAWYGVAFWYDAWAGNWVSGSIWRVPLWIPYLSMPLGFGLTALQYLADLYLLVTGAEAPFGMTEPQR